MRCNLGEFGDLRDLRTELPNWYVNFGGYLSRNIEHAEQPQARNSEGLCRKFVRGAFRPRRARALRIFKEGRRSRGIDFRRRSPSLDPEEFRREVVGGTTSAGGMETSPPSSGDDEGPAVSASSVQRRSAEAEPPPERRLPTPARQAPAQPSPAACRAPAPPALEPLASKGPGTGHWYRRLWHQRRKSTSPRGGNRKSTHRTPPWLKDVRRLQRTTRLLIPRLSFARVVREMLQGLAPSRSDRYYMQGLALQALQEASELFVTNFLSASYLFSRHVNRKTLMRKDVTFLQDLLKISGTSLVTDLLNFSADFIYLFIYLPSRPEAL
ncbi:uncharacterized protein ISCGN_019003 [Ixodes scapularis]